MAERREDAYEQHHPRELIRDLVERKLDWRQLKEIQSGEKDPDRFDKYLSVLQERVPWKETILLPIHDHLFIVAKEGRAITKTLCGQELGDWRENWKLRTRIRVRRTREELLEVYAENVTIDPTIVELREFVCPGCGTLLDVDAAAPHYPIERDFLPDLKTFYEDWLGRELPVDVGEFEDRSLDVIRSWGRRSERNGTP
jgi:acetone carboxylase gamma subunit